jgi:hypothetical protein
MSSFASASITAPRHVERRKAERINASFKLNLEEDTSIGDTTATHLALLKDISLLGACVATRHRFSTGEHIKVTIPTQGCPADIGLPDRFNGQATVQRVDLRPDKTRLVAIRFGPALAQNADFAVYMAYLIGSQPSSAFHFSCR